MVTLRDFPKPELAFTFSFDEFMIAWFIAGFDPTLPVAIFSVLKAVIDPSLNAIGTIAFLISGIVSSASRCSPCRSCSARTRRRNRPER